MQNFINTHKRTYLTDKYKEEINKYRLGTVGDNFNASDYKGFNVSHLETKFILNWVPFKKHLRLLGQLHNTEYNMGVV